jgi:hypothetical protein
MKRFCSSALAVLACSATLSIPVWAQAGPNLLLNGDAEIGHCTDDKWAMTTIPGWTVTEGYPTLFCRSAAGKRATGGAAIWSGPYGRSALTQTIQLRTPPGDVTYALSGRFGSVGGKGTGALTAEFLDDAGKAIGSPIEVNGKTRESHGGLPAGARSIQVALHFTGTGGLADDLSLTVSSPVTPATLAPPKSEVPPFDHVFIVMMENTDYGQIIGDTADAPYVNSLLAQGTSLRNFQANYHPSDENYLAVAAGDTLVKGGQYFPKLKLDVTHIGDRIEAVGKSWKSYEQGMGTPCNTSLKYDKDYEPDEAPFVLFANVIDNKTRCRAHLVDIKELNIDLAKVETTPAFAWIAADDYYDGEASGNGSPKSLRVQDKWLKETLTSVFDSPAWRTQRSLLILTWDESNTADNNHIATVVLGSQRLVRAGAVSDRHYDHYSTGRTIEEALGLNPLTENDRYAEPINDAFGQ